MNFPPPSKILLLNLSHTAASAYFARIDFGNCFNLLKDAHEIAAQNF
jgi:hypothetical protein